MPAGGHESRALLGAQHDSTHLALVNTVKSPPMGRAQLPLLAFGAPGLLTAAAGWQCPLVSVFTETKTQGGAPGLELSLGAVPARAASQGLVELAAAGRSPSPAQSHHCQCESQCPSLLRAVPAGSNSGHPWPCLAPGHPVFPASASGWCHSAVRWRGGESAAGSGFSVTCFWSGGDKHNKSERGTPSTPASLAGDIFWPL